MREEIVIVPLPDYGPGLLEEVMALCAAQGITEEWLYRLFMMRPETFGISTGETGEQAT